MTTKKLHISEEPHSNDLESLGSIFVPIVKEIMNSEDFIEADILLNWYDVVGQELGRVIRPIKIKYDKKENQRVLYVEVPVGGYALEIQHREKYILEKINAYFGYSAIQKLNKSQNPNMRPLRTPQKAKEEKKKKKEEKYVEEIADGIKDEKLKEILIKLGKSVVLSNREK